ncbi:MAG: hypothetical protein Ct9H300mP15_17030 [Gemmatimonadota bacterium]|nr:MAG: hypothetical protein Ct9H300mP15_17030 [Gemmatimonadota bacterium]
MPLVLCGGSWSLGGTVRLHLTQLLHCYAGWSLFYFYKSAGWMVTGFPSGMAMGDLFGEQSSNGTLQLGLSLGFSIATVSVVYLGGQKGIERIARTFLPILGVILVLLLFSALGMSGSGEALPSFFSPTSMSSSQAQFSRPWGIRSLRFR